MPIVNPNTTENHNPPKSFATSMKIDCSPILFKIIKRIINPNKDNRGREPRIIAAQKYAFSKKVLDCCFSFKIFILFSLIN